MLIVVVCLVTVLVMEVDKGAVGGTHSSGCVYRHCWSNRAGGSYSPNSSYSSNSCGVVVVKVVVMVAIFPEMVVLW